MRKVINNLIAALLICTGLTVTSCSLLDLYSKAGDYSITGKITDRDGAAVGGVNLSVLGSSGINTESSADGSFTLSGVSKGTLAIVAKKSGVVLVPDYENAGTSVSGSYINVGAVASHGVVYGANFIAIPSDELTIADVQGSKAKSPLAGETVTVTGVVTMVTNLAPHYKYNNSDLEGEEAAQYVGSDGFFLEALPEDKDLTGTKSNGIYIDTHDYSSDSTKWLDGIPTDLSAGDVVTVTGLVREIRTMDHYGSSANSLTKTTIYPTTVFHVEENGVKKTAGYPDGVLLTYSSATSTEVTNWLSGHETDGKREFRTMVCDSNSSHAQKDAIDVLETVESMVIRIDNPIVTAATYYNMTGVLADGGKKEDGSYMRTFNSKWMGNVIRQNPDTGYQDYNEETLFIDYQAVDWTTFYPLSQLGDTIVDSTGAKVFRGVMDYTYDVKYMAHPLNTEAAQYVQGTVNYTTPYYTQPGSGSTITSVTGETIPNQGWNFDYSSSWYYAYGVSDNYINAVTAHAVGDTSNTISAAATKSSSSNISTYVKAFRTGTSSSASFDADALFTPAWKDKSSTTTGNIDATSLTVSSFNLENYEAQGSTNSKDEDVALVVKNNLLYPDVLCVVEMGDDVANTMLYENQDNAYCVKNGVVTAVKNFSDLSDKIAANGGPRYEFRCIDPREGDSGGKSGVNIRLGFLYNTERVEFVDSGLITNHYSNTHKDGLYGSSNYLDESEWPVQTANDAAGGWALNDVSAVTQIYADENGVAHLSQSPCYYNVTAFKGSRRPLVGEFKLKGTDENFFVIACHLSSKRGDQDLYGESQPPVLYSETGRSKQSLAVNELIHAILEKDSDARIVVCGDMNDFAYSTPQKILTGEYSGDQVLYSLTESDEIGMPDTERFSYTFEGNMQQIDHIFVSKSLYDKAVAAAQANELGCSAGEEWKNVCFIPHIDSTVTRLNHANLSDHDPDMIRIPGAF